MASNAASRFSKRGIDDTADAIFSAIDSVFVNLGTDLVKDLQRSLRRKGVLYGGQDSKLSNLIRFDISNTQNGISFKLLMPDYGFAVDGGRRKTENDGGGKVKDNIEDWVKRKGIVGKFQKENLEQRLKKQSKNPRKKLEKIPFDKAAKQLAFLVSRKIHRNGYKGNNFYSEVINKLDTKVLSEEISKILNEQVAIQIKKR